MANNLLNKQTSLSEEKEELKKDLKALRHDQERQKGILNDLEQYGRRKRRIYCDRHWKRNRSGFKTDGYFSLPPGQEIQRRPNPYNEIRQPKEKRRIHGQEKESKVEDHWHFQSYCGRNEEKW